MKHDLPARKHAVAISGDLGSGKSRVARQLAQELDVNYVSTGDLHRAIANDRNLSTLELNRIAESDRSIDEEVDAKLSIIAKQDTNLVIDSRMAWWFIPYALSVHLTVLPDVGARRVMERGDQAVEAYASELEARMKLRSRAGSERMRFMNLYGVDPHRLCNYDLIVDTTYLSPEQVVAHIIRKSVVFDPKTREPLSRPPIAISPRALFPTQSIRELSSSNSADLVNVGYAYPAFFIIDGHNRTARALDQRITMIETRLGAEGDEEIVPGISAHDYFIDSVNSSRIHDWNAVFGTQLTLPMQT